MNLTIDWEFFASQIAEDSENEAALGKAVLGLDAGVSTNLQDRSLSALHYGGTETLGDQIRVGGLEGQFSSTPTSYEFDDFGVGGLMSPFAATDAGGLARTESFEIRVSDVNEVATAIGLDAAPVAENEAGAAVGTVTIVDPDAGDGHQVTVSDDRFEIIGDQLQLKDGVSLDHEEAAEITVEVTATDAGGLARTESFEIRVSDVNEVATAIGLDAAPVAENEAGAAVGTVTIVDPDAGDGHQVTVSDDRFEIIGDQLQLKDGVSLDHEEAAEITVEVTATDAGGLARTESFEIRVSDVNEVATAIGLDAAPVAENEAGAAVGTVTIVDPDAGDGHQVTVSDDRFEIIGDQLQLKDGVSLDHEEAAEITVEVTATDAGGLARTESFEIRVSDVNEVATAIGLDAAPVAENEAGAAVGTVTIVDPDAGDGHQVTVSDDRFEIIGDQLQLKDGVSLDHEEAAEITVEVTATDAGGLARTESFEIRVSDVNEVATAIGLDAAPVAENEAGAAVGTVTIVDPDAGDGHQVTVSDDRFEIIGDQLQLKDGVSLDHEEAAEITVEVTATDAGGLARTESFEIRVSDVNEVATAIGLDAAPVAENEAGAAVGTVTIVDPDAGDGHQVTVSDDRFEIIGDQLQLKDGVSLDHEEAAEITVEVTATDAGGLARTESFEISVSDVNEVATAIGLDAAPVAENEAGAAVGTVTIVDPDAGDGHQVTVSDDRFEIIGDQLQLKDGVSLDHEEAAEITVEVTATDAGGLARTESFEIRVSDVNEVATAIGLDAAPVAENEAGAAVGTVTIVDPDAGDGHQVTVSDDRFEIIGDQLQLKDGVSLDHEEAAEITVEVTATDAGGLARTESFEIRVSDVNEVATAIGLDAAPVAENEAGAAVGTVTIVDPDAGDGHQVTVSDDRFEIIGDQLQLKDGVSLDHEEAAEITVEVTATDAGGLARTESFEIRVSDVNEVATAIGLDAAPVAENEAGAAVGTVTIVDPDAGDGHQVTVSDDRFEIIGDQLQLKDGVSLDHEEAAEITVEVTATDAGGLARTESFEIRVSDVNEVATAIGLDAAPVAENEAGAAVGTVTIVDPDAGDGHQVTVSDDRFEIIGDQLQLKDGVSLDHEEAAEITVEVTATDAGGLARTESFEIRVSDVNEVATAIGLDAAPVAENEAGAAVGTVTIVDPDAGDGHQVTVSDDRFEIIGDQLQLKDGVSLDHEEAAEITVEVTATDAGGLARTESFEIRVSDVNEVATAIGLDAAPVAENEAGAAVGTVTIVDPDAGDGHQVTVSDDRFEIIGDQLQLKDGVSLDHEEAAEITVEVTATDAGGLARTESFEIRVSDVNEVATAIGLDAAPVAENEAGAAVGTVTIVDPDAGDGHQVTVSDDRFEIIGDQLQLKDGVSLDHEEAAEITVEVTATDAGGLARTESFEIRVSDVNEVATAIGLDAAPVAENEAGAAVGTVTIVDPDAGDGHQVTVSDDRFEIIGDQLQLKDGVSLDHEEAAEITVEITATDAGGLARTESFEIRVSDVNEVATAIGLDAAPVAENEAGAAVGTVTIVDPDAGDGHQVTVSDDRFEIIGDQLQLKDGVSLDHEEAAEITVEITATDAGGLARTESFEIRVSDVNEVATAIGLDAAPVAENEAGAAVGTVTIVDPDAGDGHQVTVSDDRFEIIGDQLQLKDGVSLDHEEAAEITVEVTATDAGGLARTESFEIRVSDVNEVATAIGLDAAPVAENEAGAAVGTVTIVDPDAGDGHQVTVSDDRFEIIGDQLQLKDGVSLDHEEAAEITVEITATDAGGLARTESFEIRVSDVNEVATAIGLDAAPVAENEAGAAVGTVTIVDPDAGDGHQVTVSDDRFEIIGDQLQLKDGVSLDHEEAAEITVEVTATDAGGLARTESFEIRVSDVNEVATAIGLDAAPVAENEAGAAVGTVTIVDPDAGDGHQVTVSDDRFEIIGDQLQLKDGVSLDHEEAAEITVEVTATDAGGLARTESFEIRVSDVNEVATAIGLDAAPVAENEAGAAVGTVTIVDPDAGDGHQVTVSDDRFEIIGDQLQLKDGVSLDHEEAAEITVEVTATDAGGLARTESFEISVSDVNEVATAIGLDAAPVAENEAGAAVGTVTIVDPDAGDGHQVTVSDDRFEIIGDQLQLKDGVSLDHEEAAEITVEVTATDAGGLARTESFEIRVSDVNEVATAIGLDAAPVAENEAGAAVGTVTIVDPDAGDGHQVTVSDDRFEIIGDQLQLKDGVSLDHEEAAEITVEVTATDAGGLARTESFEIRVSDVNEVATAIGLDAAPVAENEAGAAVGTVTIVDPDAGDGHQVTVSDDRFEIIGDQLQLKDGVSLDHEEAAEITVEITATDAGGLARTESFEISVSDVNEVATAIGLSNSNIEERITGATIGDLSAIDPDANDAHTFTTTDDRFEVVGTTLKLKDGEEFDFEAEPLINVEVIATDEAGASIARMLQINVADDGNQAATLDLNVVALDAPGTNGIAEMTFSTVSVENSGLNLEDHGVGETALWSNVGEFQGIAFDVKATVLSTDTEGYQGSFFDTSNGNATFWMNSGEATVKYEYFRAGTDEKFINNGSFLIDDIDGSHAGEAVSLNVEQIDAFGIETQADMTVSQDGADFLNFAGIGYTNSGDSTNAVAFNMNATSEFTLTYNANAGGRRFHLDGDWSDSYFDNVAVTDTNLNHADVFTEGGEGTQVASSQISITDNDNEILESATILLVNAQSGDQLNVGNLPDGVEATVDDSAPGQILVTLTGSVPPDDYEAALKEITFSNPDSDLATIPRTIEIKVFDGDLWSETAEMTVHVNEIGGDGTTQNTGGDTTGDRLEGSSSGDALSGLGGDDTLFGGGGDDTLIGGEGADVLEGGEGLDRADYQTSEAGIAIDLEAGIGSGGDAEQDQLNSVEIIHGSGFGDTLSGSEASEGFYGGEGADLLSGNDGADWLHGGEGVDTLDGGDGEDIAGYWGETEDLMIDLAAGVAQGGQADGDVLIDIEHIAAGSGNDRVSGDDDGNWLFGRAGDDMLFGDDGDDALIGGEGDDTLSGGDGVDGAVFKGAFSDYEITVLEEGKLQIADQTFDRDGVDVVEDVEVLQFSDGYYVIGTDTDGKPALTGPDGDNTSILSLDGYAPQETPISLTTGFVVDFIDFDENVSELSEVDWDATPTHQEVSAEINYQNGAGSFWEGGSTDTFAARATGSIHVETGGAYSFRISSDDGSELFINGEPVTSFDGLHSYQSKMGEIELPPGEHIVEVRYFENHGHAGLKLEYDGPDTSGFETVTASDDLSIAADGIAAVKLELGDAISEDATITLSGLPENTIVFSGEDSMISDGGSLDVSDWNLDLVQIAPPKGFTGQIDVSVVALDDTISTERTFSVSVDDPANGSSGGVAIDNYLLPDSNGSPQESWMDTVDAMNSASDALDSDANVFDEPVELVQAIENEAEMLNSYETSHL